MVQPKSHCSPTDSFKLMLPSRGGLCSSNVTGIIWLMTESGLLNSDSITYTNLLELCGLLLDDPLASPKGDVLLGQRDDAITSLLLLMKYLR